MLLSLKRLISFTLFTLIFTSQLQADVSNFSEQQQTRQILEDIISGETIKNIPKSKQTKLINNAKCILSILDGKKREALTEICHDIKNIKDKKRRLHRANRRKQRIVNGLITKDFPAAGALLKGKNRGDAKIQCSGTLIGSRTFLTAAHCIANDPDASVYKVFFLNAGFFEVEALDWPKNEYAKDALKADIALLKLKRKVPGIKPMKINTLKNITNNISGEIVGFGRTGGTNYDYGIKRVGSVKITNCEARLRQYPLICWKYNSFFSFSLISNTCNADSGGGFYIFENREYYVVGVTVGGRYKNCLSGDESYNTNVFLYKNWIVKASKGDVKLNNSMHPSIRSNKNSTSFIKLKLDKKVPKISHSIKVGDGIKSLRVAMNGEDNGESKNNFDLYVKQNNSIEIKKADCIENGIGQFAYCEISNPKPGLWSIIIRRVKGQGQVQITITTTK